MQRRWSRIFALALGIPLLLATLAACGGTGVAPSGTGSAPSGPITLKIASDFPTTGADQSSGAPAENGAHFAVDEANAAKTIPNVNLEFVPKDDVGPSGAHDPAVGQKNVQDLIGDALVVGMVGPLNSNVARAEMPVANNASLAMVSPANTNDCLTKEVPADECGGKNSQIATYRPTGNVTYFRVATRDVYQGGSLADFGYDQKGYRKVYIVDDAETYGVGIAGTFELEWKKKGGTVIAHKSVPGTTTSFVGLLTEIASTNPDLIFFGGNDSTGGIPMRTQMAQVPALKNVAFIGGDGMKTQSFSKNIVPLGGGPVFSSTATADVEGATGGKDFVAKFSAKYGLVGSYSAGAFDSANIIIQAVKKVLADGKVAPPKDSGDAAGAKAFRTAVVAAIQNTDYTGVLGHVTFDKDGDTTNRIISIYTLGDPTVGDGWKYLSLVNVTAA